MLLRKTISKFKRGMQSNKERCGNELLKDKFYFFYLLQ